MKSLWWRFKRPKLVYLAENADWSIMWDAKYLTSELNRQGLIKSTIQTQVTGLRNKILHFGSIHLLATENGFAPVDQSNKIVVTWFHVDSQDPKINLIPELSKRIDVLHTSTSITKDFLINHGFDANKIVVIPLGVDLKKFMPYSQSRREKIKEELNLPKNKFIIGSFQKDGHGWDEGLEPKLIKGPDIFCEVIKKLASKYQIHVLLTGPARGYVKKRLTEMKVSFTHKYLKNYLEIVDYYNCLDLYLITSRAEGGPKAVLESWATGVPLVSTRVGMANDLVKNGESGLLAEVEGVEDLFYASERVLTDQKVAKRLVINGLNACQAYEIGLIAKRYYNEIYLRF